MERLFMQNISISIKQTADLMRYQNVWQSFTHIEIRNFNGGHVWK